MRHRIGMALAALALAAGTGAATASPALAAPAAHAVQVTPHGVFQFAQPEADNAAAQARMQHEPAIDDMITPGIGLADICDNENSGNCLEPNHPATGTSGYVLVESRANSESWEVECQGNQGGQGCNVTQTWPFTPGSGMNAATYNNGGSYVVNLLDQSGGCAYEEQGALFWHLNGCITGSMFVVYRWSIISVQYSDNQGALTYTTSQGVGKQVLEQAFITGQSQWGN